MAANFLAGREYPTHMMILEHLSRAPETYKKYSAENHKDCAEIYANHSDEDKVVSAGKNIFDRGESERAGFEALQQCFRVLESVFRGAAKDAQERRIVAEILASLHRTFEKVTPLWQN